jgi:hypothetical protein
MMSPNLLPIFFLYLFVVSPPPFFVSSLVSERVAESCVLRFSRFLARALSLVASLAYWRTVSHFIPISGISIATDLFLIEFFSTPDWSRVVVFWVSFSSVLEQAR